MDISAFSVVERPSFDNELPPPGKRQGEFWRRMASMLAVEPDRHQRPGERDFEYDAVARRDQRMAAMNAPPTPLQAIAGDVVDSVVEAVKQTVAKVKKPTAIARAVEWLKSALNDGPQPQKVIEAMAQNEGISARTLKRAKAKASVVSERKGRDYWIWRLGVVKSKEDQEP